jgi:hypothetical protein
MWVTPPQLRLFLLGVKNRIGLLTWQIKIVDVFTLPPPKKKTQKIAENMKFYN